VSQSCFLAYFSVIQHISNIVTELEGEIKCSRIYSSVIFMKMCHH
jgi:hypothetical protein